MLCGIAYKARAGKDTAAEALVRDLGFTRIGFADALKDLALKLNPIVMGQMGAMNVDRGDNRLQKLVHQRGWEGAKSGFHPEVRRMLQALGVGVRDVLGEDTWVNLVLDQYPSKVKKLVVPDVRFPNEAEAIRRKGGVLVRIDRKTGYVDNHESETALNDFKDWDLVLANNGGINELQDEIVSFVKGLQTPELDLS